MWLRKCAKKVTILVVNESGHVILMDYNTTGDGQFTAVQLTKIMKETGKTLSELEESYDLSTKISQYSC